MNKFKKGGRIFFLLFLFLLLFIPNVFAHDTISAKRVLTTQDTDATFVVSVSNLEAVNGINNLSCTVWSATGSTNDIKSNTMALNADGSYSYTVDMTTDHGGDKGMYYIEIHGEDNSGKSGIVSSTYLVINSKSNEWKRYAYSGSSIVENTYRAVLTVNQEFKNGTLEANKDSGFKSGYGYSIAFNTNVASNTGVTASTTLTGAQNVSTFFPEFNYLKGVTINDVPGQYSRMSEITKTTNENEYAKTTLEFEENPFSANNSRVHFTPLWFPDKNYEVYAEVFDAWTPGGMLSTAVTSGKDIEGTVYDDWQVTSK